MINNTLFRPSVLREARKKFNPEGFDLTAAIKAREARKAKAAKVKANREAKAAAEAAAEAARQPEQNTAYRYVNAFSDSQPVERTADSSVADVDAIIRATYKQVFGNAHFMDSERSVEAESRFRSGEITVMEFVRVLAKSDRYRALFFENCTNLRTIELNFKHLLGRAPDSAEEVSEHIRILVEDGLDAEIDSYLDSDEYFQAFGTNIVPYYRGYQTQTGQYLARYTRAFELLRGASSSDRSTFKATSPQLQDIFLENKATRVRPLAPIPNSIPEAAPPEQEPFQPESPFLASSYQSQSITASNWNWAQTFIASQATGNFPASKESQPVKVFDGALGEELEVVIRAAYKQVFGNVHLMESERAITAESQFTLGNFTVRDFVRALAKSDKYRSLFFERCSNVRAIELNFKHLLGRAPDSYDEISEHIAILADGGWDAEIDSYLDSAEYQENFGEDTVPYYVSFSTQMGKNGAGYTRIFQLRPGASSSDRSIASSTTAQLQNTLLGKLDIKRSPLSNSTFRSPLLDVPSSQKEAVEDYDVDIDDDAIDLEENVEPSSTESRNLIQYRVDQYWSQPIEVKNWWQEFRGREAAATFPAARESEPVKLYGGATGEELNIIIRAAYKQVFGNMHLMESERITTAESQFKQGNFTVKEFVRALAKSETYRARFAENCPNVRAIELNFKHLLGRAPDSFDEVSEHLAILGKDGWDAEIDSYINSAEYQENFGDDTVPYYVSFSTQTGKNVAGYNRIFKLRPGASNSDKTIGNSVAAGSKPQLQTELISAPMVKTPTVFNPTGYYIGKPRPLEPYEPATVSEPYIQALADTTPVEFVSDAVEEKDLVIAAAYKQVFGNAHLMESERIPAAESQLRNGQITVMEFIRQLAQSDRYRSLVFEKNSNLRAIELNFKHLLGRAPENYAEISEHIVLLNTGGFDAEIDSYLDSEEYLTSFGTNIVPYYRGYQTQPGRNIAGYTHSFQLLRGASSSDKSTPESAYTTLDESLLGDRPNEITPLVQSANTLAAANDIVQYSRPPQSPATSGDTEATSDTPTVTDPVELIRRALNLQY